MGKNYQEDDFGEVVIRRCREMTEECLDFLVDLVKKARVENNRVDVPERSVIDHGIKAANTIMAYAVGQPTQKFEHSGKIETSSEGEFDPSKLSDEALEEIMEARKNQSPTQTH